jgi:hypothetical protein
LIGVERPSRIDPCEEALKRAETGMVACIDAPPACLSTVELIDSVQLVAQLYSDAAVLLAQLVNECAGRDLPKRVGATSAKVVSLGKVGGRVRISGWLDTESAAHVSAALDPLSKPLPGDDGPDPRSAGQRRADALVEVCQHASKAPVDGGERP